MNGGLLAAADFAMVAMQLFWMGVLARFHRSGPVPLRYALAPVWLAETAWRCLVVPWLAARREHAAFLPDVGELLDHFQSSLSVGLPLRQTLEEAHSLRFGSSLAKLSIDRMRASLTVGSGVGDVLRAEGAVLLERGGHARLLGMLFANLALCERLGANTAEVVGAVRARLAERAGLLRKLRSDTAQVKFQANVLCAAPFAFALGYALLSPARFAFFLETGEGVLTLAIVGALNALGALITFRLASPKSVA